MKQRLLIFNTDDSITDIVYQGPSYQMDFQKLELKYYQIVGLPLTDGVPSSAFYTLDVAINSDTLKRTWSNLNFGFDLLLPIQMNGTIGTIPSNYSVFSTFNPQMISRMYLRLRDQNGNPAVYTNLLLVFELDTSAL